MVIKKWFSSKTAIILAAVVLIAYLILILAVTNLGQQRLKESQYNELQLKVTNYADTLGFFFEVNQDNIDNIATDKTMRTFFANLASGMSMEYGLGSSLFNLNKLIGDLARSGNINGIPIYERIALVDLNRRPIVDTNQDTTLNISQIPFSEMEENTFSKTKHPSKIIAINTPAGLKIKIVQTVYYQNKPSALLIAEINHNLLIRQLLTQRQNNNNNHIQLSTPIGNIQAWNSFTASNTKSSPVPIDDIHNAHIYVEAPIRGTIFSLEAWFEPVGEQDIFTSGWFVLGISILAFPVLMGLYYLMRINKANIILHTKVELSTKQQTILAEQNTKLQTEVTKRKQSEQELVHQANHDSLTQLPNRSCSQNRLIRAINHSQRDNTQILIMFIDLDNFKQINDTLGHGAGDQILQQTSERLISSVRNTDTVARLGGDEFLLIIPKITGEKAAQDLACKILTSFEQPFHIDNQEFFTSTSIGMSIYPQDGKTPKNLLKNADTALYRVKEAGRNGFSFYEPSMNHDVQRNLLLNSRLRQAISNNELVLYYQPIIDLKTRKIIAAEALLRWQDKQLGSIAPDEFIPLAEKNGLIHIIGERALEQACTQAAEWQSISPVKIAVNFSCVQFRYCDQLLLKIREILKKSGLPANKLEMEVTESLLINQDDNLMSMLEELKADGVQLSIDDFGTGYSALSYLQKFSFSTLKIDRAFISNMATNSADMSLVTAILAMASALKLTVIAEGIENDWQADLLERQQCEYGQGYLFSKAVSAAEFKKLLLKDNQCKTLESLEYQTKYV
ncbi:GGDEF-domain containing protein [Psychromonas sp. MB-3u-54]|uniref:putative bifunctional diguanylate cyclase/phosphodiesterase n=1 Tax=Psychromonas sp. MB-3u-54 TaxID=2058319 RepID=UPI000C334F62|nr:EAL domain-containing protein [Psychromonas sp. MB-3u-54]PKH02363.1 GGDEF-domain containing protein [Psychromonas sp. MB-3u-54]